MLTAAEVSAAAITRDNAPEYIGCVVFVLFVFWLLGKVWE